jgi:hypothetical protein
MRTGIITAYEPPKDFTNALEDSLNSIEDEISDSINAAMSDSTKEL